MEEFINNCTEKDLMGIIDRRFVPENIENNLFAVFNTFDNREILNAFEETKRFYKINNKINEKKDNDSEPKTSAPSSILDSSPYGYTVSHDSMVYGIYSSDTTKSYSY
jgi:hypothetical protein